MKEGFNHLHCGATGSSFNPPILIVPATTFFSMSDPLPYHVEKGTGSGPPQSRRASHGSLPILQLIWLGGLLALKVRAHHPLNRNGSLSCENCLPLLCGRDETNHSCFKFPYFHFAFFCIVAIFWEFSMF